MSYIPLLASLSNDNPLNSLRLGPSGRGNIAINLGTSRETCKMISYKRLSEKRAPIRVLRTLMEDNSVRLTTTEELQAAMASGVTQGKAIWNDYASRSGAIMGSEA